MKIVGMYNQKGGVGKTSMCVNLAAVFADIGYKVAIIDMDGQCNATRYLLSDDEEYFINGQYLDDNYNIANIITGDCSVYNCETVKTYTRFSNFKKIEYKLSIIPGTPNINYLEYNDMFCLRNNLASFDSEFDFIFIDLPPSDSTAVAVALSACNYVLCPSEADVDSVDGFNKLLDLVADLNINYNADITVLGIFINKFMKVRVFQKDLLDALFDKLVNVDKNYLFKTVIPSDPRVPESRSMLIPLESYAHSCDANKALHKLAKEILEKINQ